MDKVAKALDQLAANVAENAENKGFWDYEHDPIPTKLALIHSEVTEALNVHRDVYSDSDYVDIHSGFTPDQEDEFTEELADIIIRTLDLAGHYGLGLGESLVAKLKTNTTRPYLHNRRY